MAIGRPDAQQFRLTRTLFGRSGLRLEGKDHVGHQAKALAKLEIQLPIEFRGRRCSGVGRVIHMWRTDIFTFTHAGMYGDDPTTPAKPAKPQSP